MHRSLLLRQTTTNATTNSSSAVCRRFLSSFVATKTNLSTTSALFAESKSTIFTSTKPHFAFESRSVPKNVVAGGFKKPQQPQNPNENEANFASSLFAEPLSQWKRISAEVLKSGDNAHQLKLDFLNSVSSESVSDSAMSQIHHFDSPFLHTLFHTAALVLSGPYLSGYPSAFTKEATNKSVTNYFLTTITTTPSSSSTATSNGSPVLILLAKSVEFIVQKRQSPTALENANLSLDAAIVHYALNRMGLFSTLPNLSSSQEAIFLKNYFSSAKNLVLSEISRRLSLNQRELRVLNAEALCVAIFTTGYVGRSSLPAGEACLLKLGPTISQVPSLSLISLVASFVFDPANTSSGVDRSSVSIRKFLKEKFLASSSEMIAGTQSAVVASIVASLLRDPCLHEQDISTREVLIQYSEILEHEQAIASPKSALELVRAFAENLVDRGVEDNVHHSANFSNIPQLRKAIASFCGKAFEKIQVVEFDPKNSQSVETLMFAVDIFFYLSLPSMLKNIEELSEISKKLFNFLQSNLIPACLELLTAQDQQSQDVAWIFADSLLSGIARMEKHLALHLETTTPSSSSSSLHEKLSRAYLQSLLNNTYNNLTSSQNEQQDSNNNLNNTKTALKIAALLKSPGVLKDSTDLQRLITTVASPHATSLKDILIILEGLTSASCYNTHEARQIARSIAPVNQVGGATPSATTPATPSTSTNQNSDFQFCSREDLIRVAHCYGLLRVRDDALCQAIINRSTQIREELSAEDIGCLVFALARMDERNSKVYVDLAHRVRGVTALASASAATSIIVAYSRVAAVWNYTMYFRLCERIVEQRASWKRREMLPLLMALLRLELRHEKIIELVTLEVMKADASTMSSEESVRFLSALTQFTPNTPVVTKLGQIFVRRQNELSAVQLGEVLSSIGRSYEYAKNQLAVLSSNKKPPHHQQQQQQDEQDQQEGEIKSLTEYLKSIKEEIFEKLVLRTTVVAPTAPPVAISSILNGFALVEYPLPEIFSVLSDRLLNIKNDCPALVIGQALHAFAVTGFKDDRLFVEMIPRVRFVAHHGSPTDVANVLTAYTAVQLWHYKLFVRLAERTIAIRNECRPQHIAQILSAFAQVGMKYDKLFVELSPRIQVISGSASANDVACIVSAYAAMDLYDAPVFSQMADRAVQIANQFSSQDALRVIESFDKLSIQHEACRKALGKKAEIEKERLAKEKPQQEQEQEQEEVLEKEEEEKVLTQNN